MRRVLLYINPVLRLGSRRYSFLFPFFGTLVFCILVEVYAYFIVKDPNAIGVLAIVIFLALVIYFSFRDGVLGGLVATTITIAYYFYIIYTRNYTGERLASGLETTIFLGLVYCSLAGTIGWLKQAVDILIEREADERKRLQTVIAQLPVGVIVTDSIGRVIQVNSQVESILGTKVPLGFRMGEESLLEFRSNGKVVVPSHSSLAKALASGRAIVGREVMVKRKDGKDVYLQVNANVVRNKKGKVIAAASIINDLTAQKEVDMRKDDFVNMASHELKTPITSMKLYIDSLLLGVKNLNTARVIKIVHSLKNQTERLQQLVSDLLDVSRLQTGKLSITKEMFRLDSLIEETLDMVQVSPDEARVIFAKKIPVEIYGDKFRIYQVLTNIITNAIKYSAQGAKVIVRIKKSGGRAVVSVQDFGIGIAKEQQQKIFERLYQVVDDKEKTFPGFGMGLYISKEIVKRHRGSIWVESQKGKGSTFYFSLPVQVNKD